MISGALPADSSCSIIRHFATARDRHEIDVDIVFVAEFLLNPSRVVVVGYVPAFERTIIDRNIEIDLLWEAIGESGKLVLALALGS